jgi:rubrerythrin
MFIITIPGQIIGFLLILRKKVWKCGQCGYVFERA